MKEVIRLNERVNLTVTMNVTVPQALTLQAMFEYWNTLASMGSSRMVTFYADGDGDFRPECKVSTDVPLPELTDELRNMAAKDANGDHFYDYDNIGWHFTSLAEQSKPAKVYAEVDPKKPSPASEEAKDFTNKQPQQQASVSEEEQST